MSSVHDLAGLIGNRRRAMRMTIAVVTSVGTDGTVSVRVGGTTSEEPDRITGVPRLASYSDAAAGQYVVVLEDGADMVVLGRIA